MNRRFVIVALILLVACGRRVAVRAPAGPPPDQVLFQQGLKAFHEATPDGFQRAANAFRKASALKPQDCLYSLNLVQSLLFLAIEQRSNREEFEPRQIEATKVLDAAGPACPANEAFALRLRALISGRGPEASAMVNRALDLDSTDAMNWLIHGKVDPAGRITESGQVFAKARAAELAPESALAQFELGDYLISTEPERARIAYQRTVELSPRHFRAYLGLAYAMNVDETADVEPYYRKAVELAPGYLDGRIALGSFYAGLDEIDKAVEQYAAALAANPRFDLAEFRLGLLALYIGKPDEAERRFRAVVDLNPNAYEAYYYLGNIAHSNGELEKAQEFYEKALTYRANYIEPMYGLGLVLELQDKTDQALEQFEKVLKILPSYPGALRSRGAIRVERRQLTEALSDFQLAMRAYEQQIGLLNKRIVAAAARPQSRYAQADGKRAEKEMVEVEQQLKTAQAFRAAVEQDLRSAQ